MTGAYVESSAVLAWLLGEPAAVAVRGVLRERPIATSALTLVECDRVLHRAAVTGALTELEAARRRAMLARAARHWRVVGVDTDVVARARARFPCEPIRSLDALHLASAVVLIEELGAIDVLSLDDRVRQNATLLGFTVLPAGA